MSHRLHLGDRWWTALEAGVAEPEDAVVALGTIDAGQLSGVIGDVCAAVHGDAAGDVPSRGILILGEGEGRCDIGYWAASEQVAAAGRVTAHAPVETRTVISLPLSQARPLVGVDGDSELSLGADADWDATLRVQGATGMRTIMLPRERPADLSTRVGGSLAVSTRIGAVDLGELLARAADDGSATLAFAPGRLIVRSSRGMIGALEGDVEGTPAMATFDPAPLIAATRAVGRRGGRITVGLTSAGKLRVFATDSRIVVDVLPEGGSTR